MRLNWFAPLPPAPTEIAAFTVGLLPTLQRHADVTLWTAQPDWDRAVERLAPVRRYDPDGAMPWEELNRAEVNVYHLGNSPAHAPIWRVSRRLPGFVVLHDTSLHHVFQHHFCAQARDVTEYQRQMDRFYGDEGLRAARAVLALAPEDAAGAERWSVRLAERYPFTELALENALGVLVHSRAAFDLLRGEQRWPLALAPLPFVPPQTAGRTPTPERPVGPPYRLVVFGYLGANRRLGAVLEALAGLPQRQRFRLEVYGALADEGGFRAAVRDRGLSDLVGVHGFVAADELDAALATAHLAINLRYPSMGEASASQLRLWDHALPSLVTRVGWYARLPDEVVRFVRPDSEVADIRSALQDLLDDPDRFRRMGERGRRQVREWHTPEVYVRALRGLTEDWRDREREATARRLAERTAAAVGRWLPRGTNGAWLRAVAERIRALAGAGEAGPRCRGA